jgi:hypothetical protein
MISERRLPNSVVRFNRRSVPPLLTSLLAVELTQSISKVTLKLSVSVVRYAANKVCWSAG